MNPEAAIRVAEAEMLAPAIERSPDGIPDCVLITFTGEIVVSAFRAMFDSIRADMPGPALNIISDYSAATLFANHRDLETAYRHFHSHGIRLFRSVVIDADRGRPLFQTYATAVAESVGLRADFRHVRDRAEAIRTMRSMLAGPSPSAQGDPGAAPQGNDLDQRGLARRLGRRVETISGSTDLEFEPGGIPDSFMIHMSDRSTPEEIRRIFAALRPYLAGGTLNIVCDERTAPPAIPPGSMDGLYRDLHALGVRRYNLVVVSDQPARQEGLRHSAARARAAGIAARFDLTANADHAVLRLRDLVASGRQEA